MTLEETNKIALLLSTLYPNARETKSKQTTAMWRVMLEPYDYEPIRSAAIEWASKSHYYPHPSDLLKDVEKPTPDPYALSPEKEAEYDRKARALLERLRGLPLEHEAPEEKARWEHYMSKIQKGT